MRDRLQGRRYDCNNPRIIDPLEDGDAAICPSAGRSGTWFMTNDGTGVQSPQRGVSWWPSGLLGASAGLRPARNLAFRISGFALIPTQRPSLFLEDLGSVEQPRQLGALGRFGVELSWP